MRKNLLFALPLVAILSFVLVSYNRTAMKQKPHMNHLAIYVQDLQRSTGFYRDIIGLDTIPEPFHDGRHTWFSLGDKTHLHVISGATAAMPHEKNNHLCFSVENVEAFVKGLDQHGIAYENWAGQAKSITIRVDGIKQIWFRDPDGYWIEINDARD